MNYQDLKQRLEAELSGLSDADAAAQLNAPTQTRWQQVPKPEVENWLSNRGIMAKISMFITRIDALMGAGKIDPDSTAGQQQLQLYVAAKGVMQLFAGSIPFINGENANIQQIVNGFTAANIITPSERVDFFALFQQKVSRAQVEFGQDVTEQDIRIARLQDKADFARQKVAVWQSVLADLQNGIDVTLPEN